MNRMLAMAAVAGGLGLAAAHAAAAQEGYTVQGTQRTITGTVIDGSGTKLGKGREAISVAILGSDGMLYVPISENVPDNGHQAQLKNFAEQEVTVTGTVYPVGGANVIQIASIRRKP